MTSYYVDFDPFDFIDDDWIEAVVSVGATLPGREPDRDHAVYAAAPVRRTRRKCEANMKMAAMAARTRERRIR